jgi:hypothetical protein
MALNTSPGRERDGSVLPQIGQLSSATLSEINGGTPGAAIDSAAQKAGWGTLLRNEANGEEIEGFDALVNHPSFYTQSQPAWAGKCHAWAWAALSRWVNEHVDVTGRPGNKGVMYRGEFLSVADLKKFVMAAADQISVNDRQEMTSRPNALQTLKGVAEYIQTGGRGVVGDVHNDQAEGTREIWNQPFTDASLTTSAVDSDVEDAILGMAGQGTQVKAVRINAEYGVEVNDRYEGPPSMTSKDWNMYAVCDAQGNVISACWANDERLDQVAPNRNMRFTDPGLEYFWDPYLDAIIDTLEGRENDLVDDPFKFYLREFLGNGTSVGLIEEFASSDDKSNAKFANVGMAFTDAQWNEAFDGTALEGRREDYVNPQFTGR